MEEVCALAEDQAFDPLAGELGHRDPEAGLLVTGDNVANDIRRGVCITLPILPESA